jgi:hypothetical protein
MVSPDNSKINYIPSDDSDNNSNQPQLAPVRPVVKSTKDFKQVLGKESKGGKETKDLDKMAKKKTPAKAFVDPDEEQDPAITEVEMTRPAKEEEEDASQIAGLSLFDLSKKSSEKETTVSTGPAKVANIESPSDLFKRMSSKSARKEQIAEAPKFINQKNQAEKGKLQNFTSRYAQEQADLSYANPLGGLQPAQMITPPAPSEKIESPKILDRNLQLLIEQIVKHMYTVETQGKTDTVMTLQYPPLFKGATITVTSYDTAKGQFNISFENLTQAAQKILDMSENRKSLVSSLEQKGYNVQIITTTTIQIQNPIVAEANSREDQQNQENDQQKREQNEE